MEGDAGLRPLLLALLLVLGLPLMASTPDWTDCPSSCRCKWTSGKKSALCRDAGFTTIPDSLDGDMQVLDLTANAIPYLTKDAFASVGLLNLQRVFLRGAGVRELHRDAFRDLTILVEVDLSDNLIGTLHQETFAGNSRLRVLYLNGNPITELRSGQFPPLPHLRTLEMQHCQIRVVHRDAFLHLSALESLNLNGNRLRRISETVFLPVNKLKTLGLDGNPWRCDCELRGFRHWLLATPLYAHPLLCTAPPPLEGRHWDEVPPPQFACAPDVALSETMVQQQPGGNATFRCQVRGDPAPSINWLFNGASIGNGSVNQDQVLLIEEEDGDVLTEKWTTLTLWNLTEADAGEYSCVARNLRGVATGNVTLLLPEVAGVATTLSKRDPFVLWIVWLVFAATGLVFLSILSACIYRLTRCRGKHRRKAKLKESASFSDQEKRLLDVSVATSTERERGGGGGATGSCEGLGGLTGGQPELEMLEQGVSLEPLHITIEHGDRSHHQRVYQSPAPGGGGGVGGGTTAVVFPPPPEFGASLLPPGAFGNIFISVSVSQEPNVDGNGGGSGPRYPDLLDLPHRKSVSVATGMEPGPEATSFFATATLPRRRPPAHPHPQPQLYDNMGPRVTATGACAAPGHEADSTAPGLDIDLPPPPPPPLCTSHTVEYVSL